MPNRRRGADSRIVPGKWWRQHGVRGGSERRRLFDETFSQADKFQADFMERVKDPNRQVIHNPDGTVSTHLMSWAEDDNGYVAYPQIQNIDGKLVKLDGWDAYDSAVEHGDTLRFDSPVKAALFTEFYKKYYDGFGKYGIGGKINCPYDLLTIEL